MLNEPLGLPKGSVRAILSIGIVGASIYMFATGKVDPQEFLLVTSVVTGFYFATKKQ